MDTQVGLSMACLGWGAGWGWALEAEPLKKGHRRKKMALLTRVLRVQRSLEGVPGAPVLDSGSLKTGKCPDSAGATLWKLLWSQLVSAGLVSAGLGSAGVVSAGLVMLG